MIELAEIKFKYSYQCRDFIEKSNDKKFKLLSKKNSDKVLLEYNNILFEVNAQIDNKNIFIDSYINRDEKEKYKEEFNIESEYLVEELYKEYIGLKYKEVNYVKRNKLRVNNKNKKNYINPKVEIKGSVANIIYNDEIVAKVNDVRSISILKTINRNKDFIVINNNELEILTLKFIDRNDDEFEIIIYGDEKNYNKIKKMIDKGCRINEEFWLFSVDDEINQAEDTILIKLPDDCWAKGSLQGNKLIIKEIMRKPRTKIRGIASAIVIPVINTTFKKQEEIRSYIEKDNFNQRKYEEEKNTEFIKIINEYKKIEFEVLEENKNKCKDLRYVSLENNKFKENNLETNILKQDNNEKEIITKIEDENETPPKALEENKNSYNNISEKKVDVNKNNVLENKDENISIASKKTISSKIPLIIAGIFTIGALGVLKVLKKV